MAIKLWQPGEAIPWGKYRGNTLETVILVEPKYVLWMLDKITNFGLSDGAKQMLNERLREEKSVLEDLRRT